MQAEMSRAHFERCTSKDSGAWAAMGSGLLSRSGNCTAEGDGALAAVTCGEAAVPHWLWGKRAVSSIKGMEFLSCGLSKKSCGVIVFDGQSLEATGALGI